jgi:hypothetical protein
MVRVALTVAVTPILLTIVLRITWRGWRVTVGR